MTQPIKERDYFTDPGVLRDPYQYFEEMRPRGPVCQLETHDCLLVTGFEECVEVPLCLQADGSILNDCAPADMCTIIEDAEIDGALAPGMTRWCAATGEVCLHNESVFPGGPFPADEPVWTCEAGECSGSACVTL